MVNLSVRLALARAKFVSTECGSIIFPFTSYCDAIVGGFADNNGAVRQVAEFTSTAEDEVLAAAVSTRNHDVCCGRFLEPKLRNEHGARKAGLEKQDL